VLNIYFGSANSLCVLLTTMLSCSWHLPS